MINKFTKYFIFTLFLFLITGCGGSKTFLPNESFKTDGWEMMCTDVEQSIGKDGLKLVKVDFKMKNISGKSDYQPMARAYGPDGVEVDYMCVCDEIKNDVCYAHTMVRDNTDVETYVFIAYKGDGEYVIEYLDGTELNIAVNFN